MNVRRGDVMWADPPHDGKCSYRKMRPWVIVSNNMANSSSPMVTAVPCTTVSKNEWMPTHTEVFLDGVRSIVQCEQIKTFGKEFLGDRKCSLDAWEMEAIDQALKVHLGLKQEGGDASAEQEREVLQEERA